MGDYMVVRHRVSGTPPRVLWRGVTLEEALAHCSVHHGPRYWDTWELEPGPSPHRRGFGVRRVPMGAQYMGHIDGGPLSEPEPDDDDDEPEPEPEPEPVDPWGNRARRWLTGR